MFKKFFRKQFGQRGQVLVFYALLFPLLFLMVGAGLDLGWYYLNVSRLQNAADAAVLAGAGVFVDDKATFVDFKTKPSLIPNREFNERRKFNTLIYSQDTVKQADSLAESYVLQNIGSKEKISETVSGKTTTRNAIVDSWNNSKVKTNREVTPKYTLYDYGANLYYVVRLTEKIEHFILPGWFAPMEAPVVAVANLVKTKAGGDSNEDPNEEIQRLPGEGAETILPEGKDILTEMYGLEDVSVMRNWEWQDWYTKGSVTYGTNLPSEYADLKGTTVRPKDDYKAMTGKDIYSGKWAGYANKREGNKHVLYHSGKRYREETMHIYPGSDDGPGTKDMDSLNLDFNPDLSYDFKTDWDLDYPAPNKKTLLSIQHARSSKDYSKDEGTFKLRIHAFLNFEQKAFSVRANKISEDNPEDTLYARIESEPIIDLPFAKNQNSKHIAFSTVRQIFININQSNMDKQYRPLLLFYDGPEAYNPNTHIRDSKPVILTLNADARVILFAPNSPVVIRGNNHIMHGFVIAKEFVRLTTASDYNQVGGRYFDENGKEFFYIEEEDTFVDEFGNVDTKELDLDTVTRKRYGEDNSDGAPPEVPSGKTKIENEDYEVVYKMDTFNIASGSYYDSFKITRLKRNIYTYLDAYMDDEKENSVDMFFTKYRSSWVD